MPQIRQYAIILVLFSSLSCMMLSNFVLTDEINPISVIINEGDCNAVCLGDIIPGEIGYQEALEILISYDAVFSRGNNFWFLDTDGTRINIDIIQTSPIGGEYVSYIELSTNSGSIMTLGQLIDLELPLVSVYRSNVSGPNALVLLLVFDGSYPIYAIVSAIGELTENSPVNTLLLVAPQDNDWRLADLRNIRGFDDQIDWIGYASVDTYQDLAGNE